MHTTEDVLARVETALSRTRWEGPLCAEIRSAYHAAATHGVFDQITSPERLALFMSKHVWAVWDFMSLMKGVQEVLAPTTRPWMLPSDPTLTQLINQIVLEEEGGFELEDRPVSHFKYYLHAMRQAGADTQRVEGFLASLQAGTPVVDCVQQYAPPAAARFVRITLEQAEASPAERIAAFVFAREQLVPEMLPVMSERVAGYSSGADLGPFRAYLDRHVEMHAETQAAATLQMLEAWAGDDPAAGRAALRALQARIDLWDHALSVVSGHPS
jgi:DUF3050 family protein